MQHYQPEDVAPPRGTYSHAIRVSGGDLVFLAGQVPVDDKGDVVGRGDVRAQAEQVFENLDRVLAAAGATFRDVVKMTIFVVGRDNVEPLRSFRAELFEALYPEGRYPTTTLVVADGLASPDFLVEVEAIAAVA